MNNKKIGIAFERKILTWCQNEGFWAHFLTPDARGAQPFDVIAVKDKVPYAIECKTLSDKEDCFPFSRLEENQILACERWLKCGNTMPVIAIGRGGNKACFVLYETLKKNGRIKIDDDMCFELPED